MSFSVTTRRVFLPSLSPAAAGALPLGPSASETRQKHSPRRSLKRGVGLFRKEVWKYWKKNERHDLPWRLPSLLLRQRLRTDAVGLRQGKKNLDPYRILVSEVMLQQTQVSRVSEKYREFLEVFSTVRSLARASLLDVLKLWNGLGYNRRAKYLHDAAIQIVEKHGGKIPVVYSELVELPGMGPYTASAVRVFAFNEPDVLIETNIRAALIHHFFPHTQQVSDRRIIMYAEQAAKGQDPRKWHWALMDYGVHIKKLHKNPARRSAHYVRQSKFEGSLRQVRGAILRALATDQNVFGLRDCFQSKFDEALESLVREGLIKSLR